MSQNKRLTLNASLKNAFLFDEELDTESLNLLIRNSSRRITLSDQSSIEDGSTDRSLLNTSDCDDSPVKSTIYNSDQNIDVIKKEHDVDYISEIDATKIKIKQEFNCSETEENLLNIKKEPPSPPAVFSEEWKSAFKINGKCSDKVGYSGEFELLQIKTEESNSSRENETNLEQKMEVTENKDQKCVLKNAISRAKKRTVSDNSDGSNSEIKKVSKKRTKIERESDPAILKRRQKQIDFGKNTLGYDNYVKNISKYERKRGEPRTPDKTIKYSRRGWDGLIKKWRLQLHKYDPD